MIEIPVTDDNKYRFGTTNDEYKVKSVIIDNENMEINLKVELGDGTSASYDFLSFKHDKKL